VKVNNALRSFCASLGIDGDVTQRLKKAPTIVNKLTRESGLDLSRMQDIGGCRVVVETLPELRKLETRIRRTWGYCLDHEKDYIREPRASGYRAMHLVVLRDGRQIEIQLRTKSMHNWAEAVEAFSGTTSQNFKQDGSHVVQEFMKQLSDYNAATEAGDTPPQGSLDKLAKLSNEVSVYLKSLHPGA
uniref:RelA/SpoT domain-containing protein n=1 Tax=Arthrobacter sp. H41 TaxID=1312978 RepID=UPI00047AB51F